MGDLELENGGGVRVQDSPLVYDSSSHYYLDLLVLSEPCILLIPLTFSFESVSLPSPFDPQY